MSLGDTKVRQRKKQRSATTLLLVALSTGLVLAIVFGVINYIQGERREAAINQLGADYEVLRTAKKDLCSEKANAAKPECALTGKSAETIVEKTIERAIPIPGLMGPRGFTGPTGTAGPTPSSAFLRALAADAQARYCADGRCVPADGKDGVSPPAPKDGKQGDPGVQGQQGATGGVGATGATGATGKEGRGIISGPTCQEDGTWLTKYNQEPLEETQPGPCKVTIFTP